MHQHPRRSPVTPSPASFPQTNPGRTNSSREGASAGPRPPHTMGTYNDDDESSLDSEDSGLMPSNMPPDGPSRDAVAKLDQIIQNFHTKAAIVILNARIRLPTVFGRDGSKKINKWFQIETDDIGAFREELAVWRRCGGFQNRPPPLCIEVYLDASGLTNNQTLVIHDDSGKRWDVAEALSSADTSSRGSRWKRNSEVVLERWKIELKSNPGERPYDFGPTLPSIYKMCIVFFRSLYSTVNLVPARRLLKSLPKMGTRLEIKCRFVDGDVQPGQRDPVTQPMFESASPVATTYDLDACKTPAGLITAQATVRNNCNFRVDDTESMLSSRFTGIDEHFFQPSLAIKTDDRRRRSTKTEIGSLPANRRQIDDSDPVQAYGSMSTFHGVPARASSPISALRAAKTMGDDDSLPPDSLPQARPITSSRVSLITAEGLARRPSLSFQAFKAGSLSSSPGPTTPTYHAGEMSPQSAPRQSGISALALAQARNRSSLTAGMPASLRGGPVVPENPIYIPASSSPKPAPISRYSSSFSHRRNRPSFGGASRVLDDDQTSSGKQSFSSAQPGSGILTEGGGTGGSSGSLQTDDDNISEFLKLLENKKTLQSFEPSSAGMNRTSAQLSKFQSMRDSNNALTDSMSNSNLLHRSSSSSSRQLSSVPAMIAATSISGASSLGKPISPHTPHTPAIPSRLSANSIAEYSAPRRGHEQDRHDSRLEDVTDIQTTNELGTYAINIPTSPRVFYSHNRRSSSVAQRRSLAMDDELNDLAFVPNRSISLGAEEREAPSMSALLLIGDTTVHDPSPESPSPSHLLAPIESATDMSRQGSSSQEAHESNFTRGSGRTGRSAANTPYRPRIGRTGGRGVNLPESGSSSSLVERGSGSERGGGGRYSFSRTADTDDEPLLFDMSEIGNTTRRSIEEPRGGSNLGDRGSYESARGGDSGSSNTRTGHFSRRGW